MLQGLQSFLKRIRPEDPRRIRAFRSAIENLGWDAENMLSSQSTLFNAVDDLAQSEVKYYYRRRGTRAWISGVSRCFAWIFGTAGLILPLLAGTGEPALKELGNFGYGFLAAAASCLAANSLFGGTDGHIRFVTTQLELERLIIASRVEWCKYLAVPHETSDRAKSGVHWTPIPI